MQIFKKLFLFYFLDFLLLLLVLLFFINLIIFQLLISDERKVDCSEICSILRGIYDSMPSTVDDLNESQGLMCELMPSINLCIDYAKNSYLCSDLVKHKFFPLFYHIIRTFLRIVSIYKPVLIL